MKIPDPDKTICPTCKGSGYVTPDTPAPGPTLIDEDEWRQKNGYPEGPQ